MKDTLVKAKTKASHKLSEYFNKNQQQQNVAVECR